MFGAGHSFRHRGQELFLVFVSGPVCARGHIHRGFLGAFTMDLLDTGRGLDGEANFKLLPTRSDCVATTVESQATF